MQNLTQGAPGREWAFFAASNSRDGFHSYYEQCFRGAVDVLYIIKGGPGTGKSRLMRELAEAGEARGWRAEYYYCSSDPTSLDAVLLYGAHGQSVGLLDGTAPHTFEPRMAGVREELIDLGQFWCSAQLFEQRGEIGKLIGQKNESYRAAYRYLRAAGECLDNGRDALLPCLSGRRLERLAARLLAGATQREESGSCRTGLRTSIGMRGRYTLPTYEEKATRVCYLEDYYGVGYELAEAILTRGREAGASMIVSHHPVCPDRVDALHFMASGVSFIVRDAEERAQPHERCENAAVRCMDLRRLPDATLLRSARERLRTAARGYEMMLENACDCMATVAQAHFALESIYTAAMDFDAKERYTVALIGKIFGE
ncbi:MAG: hypothetical protein IJW97_03260 [Clostridia bacterium]|nr:hypothetical protein [Clostridia bacterium]